VNTCSDRGGHTLLVEDDADRVRQAAGYLSRLLADGGSRVDAPADEPVGPDRGDDRLGGLAGLRFVDRRRPGQGRCRRQAQQRGHRERPADRAAEPSTGVRGYQ
jgi:hypothetical protein